MNLMNGWPANFVTNFNVFPMKSTTILLILIIDCSVY